MDVKRIAKFAAIALALVIATNFAYRKFLSKPEAAVQQVNTNDYLETEVKKRLAASDVLTNEKVSVKAHDGTVTLTGTVSAEWRKISAENIAASTPAVLAVENLIKVSDAGHAPQPVWKSSAESTGGAAPEMAQKKRPRAVYVDPQTRARELAAEGNMYVSQRNYSAAIKSYNAALQLDPNNYEARSGLQEAQRMR
jgi:tetratricopeptide (TPR) repeat protein